MNLSFCIMCSYLVLFYIVVDTKNSGYVQYFILKENKFVLNYIYSRSSLKHVPCIGFALCSLLGAPHLPKVWKSLM